MSAGDVIVVSAFESPTVVAGLDDIAVVGQAVEQRGGHFGIAEHAGPFAEGYRPEYGARELKRQIRSIVETRLARAMLGGEVTQGDAIRVGWDATAEQLRIEPVGKAASKTQNVSGAKETKAKAQEPSAAGESEPGAE